MRLQVTRQIAIILFFNLSLCACATSNSMAVKDEGKYVYKLAVKRSSGAATGRNDIQKAPAEYMATDFADGNNNAVSVMPFPHRGTSGSKSLEGEEAVNTANNKSLRKPRTGGYINSIMTFDFMPGSLYQVYCAPLRLTDVQFQTNEHVVSVGAGDTLRWQVSKTYSGAGANRQEHLLIKPSDEGLTNSLVVTTDQRTYHLMLYSTPNTYMASVAWRYANDSVDGVLTNLGNDQNSTSISASELGSGLDINRLDFKYRVKLLRGTQPDWYPTMVFNDGNKTYIKFPLSAQEAPILFVGNNDKTDQLINYRVVGNYYVIDGVYPQAQLRSGQAKSTVVQIKHV